MAKTTRITVNSVMPTATRDMADKIAALYTANDGIKYSRSDVIVLAIHQLARKAKIA